MMPGPHATYGRQCGLLSRTQTSSFVFSADSIGPADTGYDEIVTVTERALGHSSSSAIISGFAQRRHYADCCVADLRARCAATLILFPHVS
jgi:hypothetical protein